MFQVIFSPEKRTHLSQYVDSDVPLIRYSTCVLGFWACIWAVAKKVSPQMQDVSIRKKQPCWLLRQFHGCYCFTWSCSCMEEQLSAFCGRNRLTPACPLQWLILSVLSVPGKNELVYPLSVTMCFELQYCSSPGVGSIKQLMCFTFLS